MAEPISKGLKDVVVANSSITAINGEEGRLRYRGYDIAELARYSTYEEVVFLLWFGRLPNRSELSDLRDWLAAQRELDESIWNMLISFPCWPRPMEALRTAVSSLSSCDPEADDTSPDGQVDRGIRITAKMPTIIAYHHRYSLGEERVHPDPALSHAANLLYMLHGRRPAPWEERAMDVALILMADHGFNASTFAARVTASTLSDLYSAITSAIGTLKGPLHGGANERAMEMLEEIGEPEKVEPYITRALARKERIMGFGHRVYKTIDPRAVIARGIICEMNTEAEEPRWCDLALRVEDVVHENKGLNPNVDFFSGPLLYTLGVPIELFTPVFAISRVAGWTAHVMEQYQDNRLIRPLAHYTGPELRPYVPIEERGREERVVQVAEGGEGRTIG